MTFISLITHELPLVLFTVLVQAAVGFSWVAALSKNPPCMQRFAKVYLGLVGLGAFASVFHLSNPMHAFYMVSRLFGGSIQGEHFIAWLPLEIAGVFVMGALGVWSLFKGTSKLQYALPLAGVLTLIAMSGAYGTMVQTVPVWNFWIILLLFSGSALVLGGMVYQGVFGLSTPMAFLASVGGFVLFALALVLYTFNGAVLHVDGLGSVFALMGGYYGVFVGWGLAAVGMGVVLQGYQVLTCKQNHILARAAMVVALGGALATRVAFYGMIPAQLFG